MQQVQSFAPLGSADARLLILGSMPGAASLRANQYYAHPRNHFWSILGELLGFDPSLPYEQRVRVLSSAQVALWDVLGSCRREGSLDSGIDDSSCIPNDFAGFLLRHPQLTRVFFNGAKAEACYRRQVLPGLAIDHLTYRRLPSTSPANAALSFERKLDAWRCIVAPR
ncbi:MAG: DNA-deoxyinosine glycosylase [Nitrosomonadales bacterium]|nr:DNA-deoxyinosine glycosylase [Nitrosomonadales bacterium]